MCCQWFLHIGWDISQFSCHHQSVEVFATSQKDMLLYDTGSFLLWSWRGLGRASNDNAGGNNFLVLWLQNRITDERACSQLHILVVQVFAFCALLTMNVDRYLAIAHPIFRKTSVTKSRLLKLMLLLQLLILVAPISCSIPCLWKLCNIVIAVFVAILATVIASHKRQNVRNSSTKADNTLCSKIDAISRGKKKPHVFVIACFFICVSPLIAYNALTDRGITFGGMFHFWANTLAIMNSSVNCVIFAWRNRTLYTEVKKTLTTFKNFTCWTLYSWRQCIVE